jgi:hypothetical protein
MIVRVTIEIQGDDSSEQLQSILKNLANVTGGPVEAAPAAAAPAEGEPAPKRRGRRPKGEAAPPAPPKRKRRKSTRPRAPRGEGVISRVRALAGDPFFDDDRTAEDVRAELMNRGYDVDVRQIYAALKTLLDAGLLERRRDNKVYTYRSSGAISEGGADEGEPANEENAN